MQCVYQDKNVNSKYFVQKAVKKKNNINAFRYDFRHVELGDSIKKIDISYIS